MTIKHRPLSLEHPHVKLTPRFVEWDQPKPKLQQLDAVELLSRMTRELPPQVRLARTASGLRLLSEVRYDVCEHNLEVQLERLGQALTGGPAGTGHDDSRSDVDVDLLSSVLADSPGPWTERDDTWVMPLPGTASGELQIQPASGGVHCRTLLLAGEPAIHGEVKLATAGYLLAAHASVRLCRAQLDKDGVQLVAFAPLDYLSTTLADSIPAVITAVRLMAPSLRVLQVPDAAKHYIRHSKLK